MLTKKSVKFFQVILRELMTVACTGISFIRKTIQIMPNNNSKTTTIKKGGKEKRKLNDSAL